MLATEILSKTNGLKNTEVLNYDFLKSIKGIGSAKACDIVAAIELGKRISMNIKSLNGMRLNNSSLVFDYYKKIIGDKKQEYFYAIYLDSSKKVIKDKVLFIPGGKGSTVGSYVIFQMMKNNTAPNAIICLNAEPIIATGAIMSDIPMVDTPSNTKELTDGTLVEVDGDNGTIEIL